MSESALYPAVKAFLAARGYVAKGEIGHCDVVAVKPGEPPILVIAELKLGLSLELILQAVDRLPCADEVWLAVPATRKGRDRDPRARKLCRLLGFGLLAINPASHRTEVLAEPEPYRPRPNLRRRRALLREHAARHGDPAPGGTRGVPIMTAYRQEALACAALLQPGPLPTRALAAASPRATAILYRNVYGWFERVAHGTYALTEKGHAATGLRLAPAMLPAQSPDPE